MSLQPAIFWPCGSKGPESLIFLSVCLLLCEDAFYWEKHALMNLGLHKFKCYSVKSRAFKETKAEHGLQADHLAFITLSNASQVHFTLSRNKTISKLISTKIA